MKILIFVLSLLFSFSSIARSSQEIRADKKFEVLYKGGYDYRMATNQFGISYFLNGDNILGARVGSIKDDDESQTNVSLEYKHFFSNSFYIAPEAFYLNTVEDELWFLSPLIKVNTTKFTSMGAGVRIGNQWSWEYISFGLDWVGIGQRIGTFHKDAGTVNKTTFTLLNLTLAVHF